MLTLAELVQTAEAHGFTCDVETHGLLAPWFLHDTFQTSRFDRRLLELLARVDAAVPRAARTFQWLAGRRNASPAVAPRS
jgi:hypothetical protein